MELERVLALYCAALQQREPPAAQLTDVTDYVEALNRSVRERADQHEVLPDPASYRATLIRYLD